MGIPIIDEIFQGIRWILDFFMDKAPKPIKILFFLLMLIGLVSMIPFFLHLFGFHCNTSSELIQVSPLKFVTNVKLAFTNPREYISLTSYIPDPYDTGIVPVFSCRKPVCFVNGTYYWESSFYCDGQTIVYPYLTTLAEWSRCITCDGDINHTQVQGQIADDNFYLCFGDAYRINESDFNFYQGLWFLGCNEYDRCYPPNHYYYEYDTGTYDCIDLEICGLNQTVNVSAVDDLLEEADGQLLYTTPSNGDYRSFLRLRCDGNLKPEMTLFGSKEKRGIPIFDYKIWLFLIIIYILFMFLNHIKKH